MHQTLQNCRQISNRLRGHSSQQGRLLKVTGVYYSIQYNTITLFALNIYMFLAHNKLIGIEKCFQREVYIIQVNETI